MDLIELERLNAELQRVPGLIDLYENREYRFTGDVKDWLQDVEQVLRAANVSIISDIAAGRGEIISAERGNRPASVSLPARATKRKVTESTALHCLNQAQSTILSAISADQETLEQAEKSLRGLLVVAKQRGILNNGIQPPFTMPVLRQFWGSLVADETIGPHTAGLLGLLRFRDALIMLGRVLDEWRADQNGGDRTDLAGE